MVEALMMTPLERAGRAAAEQYGEDWAQLPAANPIPNGELDRRHFIDQARAVLQAIREPSDGMVEAAYRREGIGPDAVDVPFSLVPDDMWQAMIDAALGEG